MLEHLYLFGGRCQTLQKLVDFLLRQAEQFLCLDIAVLEGPDQRIEVLRLGGQLVLLLAVHIDQLLHLTLQVVIGLGREQDEIHHLGLLLGLQGVEDVVEVDALD